jgi:hypothetical protein
MTRNTKIALGCGGGGCLGLILLGVVGAILVVTGVVKAPGLYSPSSNYNSNYNYNVNTNRNSNFNSNLNDNTTTASDSSTSMTDSDRHKLYQAAGMTKDTAIMTRVIRKLGLGDGTGDAHQKFIKEHFAWAMKNLDFIQSVNTPEKAKAYVDAHIDD